MVKIDDRRPLSAAWWWFPYLMGWGVFLAVEWHSAASHSWSADRRSNGCLAADLDTLRMVSGVPGACTDRLVVDLYRRIRGNSRSATRWSLETLTARIDS